MSQKPKVRRYWDAACVFGFLQNQSDRRDECDRVVRSVERGESELVISALTIAEVLYIRGPAERIGKESRELVRKFFQRRLFTVANVDRAIAEQAQDVFWDHDIRPKDSIHVATAITAGAHYLETYDQRLLDKSRMLGGDPVLVVQRPGADLIVAEAARARRDPVGSLFGLLENGPPKPPPTLS